MAAGDSVASPAGVGGASCFPIKSSAAADAINADSVAIARSISSKTQPAYWPNLVLVNKDTAPCSSRCLSRLSLVSASTWQLLTALVSLRSGLFALIATDLKRGKGGLFSYAGSGVLVDRDPHLDIFSIGLLGLRPGKKGGG